MLNSLIMTNNRVRKLCWSITWLQRASRTCTGKLLDQNILPCVFIAYNVCKCLLYGSKAVSRLQEPCEKKKNEVC